MNHYVGRTYNDIPVYVDLIASDVASYIAQQPHILTLVTEVVRHATLVEASINLEQDMGRTIGYDYVVETTDASAVFYAQLVREDIYTRFVKKCEPLPTRHLTISLSYDQADKSYQLSSVWLGRKRPLRPGSAQQTAKSYVYWGKHAFVFENQPLQLRTLTKTCPY